jgi:NADPH:quinone reductase-like Zn-dependent oxidoreductase
MKNMAPYVLQLTEVEKPIPKDNEILVKIFAVSVTSGDLRLRKADPFMVRSFNGWIKPKNRIFGINFAGKIEATGKEVRQFKIDDEVVGSTAYGFGAYAESM